MPSRLNRVRGLLRRYRSDRRLPPPVRELFATTVRLRAEDSAARRQADLRSVLGADTVSGSSVAARLGSRRLHTAGDLEVSTAELGHVVAGQISAALTARDIDHFVTGRRGDGLAFGVELGDRRDALSVLTSIRDDAWFLEWADGSGDGIVALAHAAEDRRVRRARSWVVFRAYRLGDRVVGRDQGVEITFWDLGTSGELEKVGTRGHERFDRRSAATVETVDGREYPGRTAFPVGANFEHVEGPIDVVYTWVDGSDPDWIASFRAAAQAAGRTVDDAALDPARFRSRDELRYSLRSLWANCGWVRTIWIVTAGQRPEWLVDHDRIRVVDHHDIFPADALPTFNSHSIEASLHHIDGLAEQFVYFNDDMFVARPLRPEFFFTPNGLARVYQSGARPPGVEDEHTQHVDTAALRGRELLRERFGRVVTGKAYHSPYPLRRSVMDDMEREFADIVRKTQHSRFRSSTDLSTASSFAQHYALATQRAVLGDVHTEYVHVESARLDWHLDRIRLGSDLDTFCVNETGDVRGDHDDRERRIGEFFEAMYPIAAPWEAPPR